VRDVDFPILANKNAVANVRRAFFALAAGEAARLRAPVCGARRWQVSIRSRHSRWRWAE
jgi:hypothetical protein